MAGGSEQHVSGLTVLVDGSPLAGEYMDRILSVKAANVRMLPDACTLRIQDPRATDMDKHPLKVGATLEIKLGRRDSQQTKRVFKGQIASVEPNFEPGNVTIAVRAYDLAHKLNRGKKTKTWQNSTSSDIVREVASAAGLRAATIESTGSPHPYMAQANETDWAFCWRLAELEDFEVVVDDNDFHFRRANTEAGNVTLKLGEELRSFRPRATGVQQLEEVVVRAYDPATKQTFVGRANSPERSSRNGIDPTSLGNDLGGGTMTITDRPVFSQDEANRIAKAKLDQLANAALEAEGVAFGIPELDAGVKVKVEGVGSKFSGEYAVTSVEHVWTTGGYETKFKISGRSPRTLTDLVNPKSERPVGDSLVIGLVTNNNDPDKLGRVRVKYPAIDDNAEGWWARVATTGSGKDRGLMMLPVVGEEVVVGFEAGDLRKPVVLGSVFNGKDTPGEELAATDGSFGLKSDQKIIIKSKDQTMIVTGADLVVEVQGDLNEKVSGAHKREVSGNATDKISGSLEQTIGSSLKISSSSSIEIKAGSSLKLQAGASLDIQAGAAVNIKGATVNLG
jgi:phage protein D